jgi:hypothetical protein
MLVKLKTIIFLLVVLFVSIYKFQVGKSEIKRRSKYYSSAEQAQLLIKKNEQEVKKWIDELRLWLTIDGNQIFSKEALRLINEPNYLKQSL